MDQHHSRLREPFSSPAHYTYDVNASYLSSEPLIELSTRPSGNTADTNTTRRHDGDNIIQLHTPDARLAGDPVSKSSHPITRSLYGRNHAPSILIIFALLCIVSLVVLQQLDHRNPGFSVSSSSDVIQFSWKYGPTAIFVVFLAIWRQADYLVKIRAPWEEMAAGFALAEKSVLLDYVSPILPTTFVRAIRNRHWEVVISIGIFAFLKLAVFGSTGLLNLQPTMMHNQTSFVDLVVQPTLFFNATSANPESAGRAYIAALQRQLPWPNGTTANAAFQDISTDNDLPPQASVTADVLAVYPWLSCEPANASLQVTVEPDMVAKRNVIGPTTNFYLNWTSEHTNGSAVLKNTFCDAYNKSATCPEEQIMYNIGSTLWGSDPLVEDTYGVGDAILVAVFSLAAQTSPEIVPVNMTDLNNTAINMDELHGYGWVQYLDWASVLVCKTEYAVETGQLVSSWSAADAAWLNTSLSSNLTHTERLLQNYSFANLTSDVMTALDLSSQQVEQIATNTNLDRGGWFDLMLYVMNATSLTVFKDPLVMVQPANTVFKGFASVWMGSWVSFPDHSSTVATYSYQSNRLRISYSAFWLMQASLISLFLLLISLLIFCREVRSYNFPNTPIQDALTLKQNENSLAVFKGLGSSGDEHMCRTLTSTSFRIDQCQSTNLVIDSQVNLSALKTRPSSDVASRATWSTSSSKPWYIAMLVSVSLCIMVVLEVIQRSSDRLPRGIPLNMSRQMGQDVTSFATALVMLTLSMLFSSADFAATGVSPYLLLWRKATPLRHLRTPPLQQLPPASIVSRLRARQLGVVSIMIAALLGSILTIIGSGLFTIIDDSKIYPTSVKSVDAFNLDAPLSSDSTGALTFSFLQNNNASYVDGVHDEFAFAILNINDFDPHVVSISQSTQTTIAVEMPVLRASLNCSRTQRSDLTLEALNVPHRISPDVSAYLKPYANVTSTESLPEECQSVSPVYGDSETYRVASSIGGLWIVEGNTTRGAEMENVNGVLRDDPTQLSSHDIQYFTHYPPGCPSVAFTIGSYTVNSTDVSTTTRMVCSQYWEEIPALLTFDLPGLKLNSSLPPVLYEERRAIVSRLSWNLTDIFGYRLPTNTVDDDLMNQTDSFYHAVVYGIDGVPIDDMIGDQNYERFFNATQHTYRQYMAQVIGNDMRTTNLRNLADSSTTPIGSRFAATVVDTTRIRVVQSKTAMIVLQAVLAAMIVFLLAGSRDLIACGKILTHNPFHVAGRMSYIADSKLVDHLQSNRTNPDRLEAEFMRQFGSDIKLRLKWWQSGTDLGVISPVASATSSTFSPSFEKKTGRTQVVEVSDNQDDSDTYDEGRFADNHGFPATTFQIRRKPVMSLASSRNYSKLQEEDHSYQSHHYSYSTGFDSLRSKQDQQRPASSQGQLRFGIDIAE